MGMSGTNYFLKAASVVLSLHFFVPYVQGTLDKNSEIYLKHISLVSGLRDTRFLSDFRHSSSNSSSITCNSSNKCNNGGSCRNEICLCLPGTSGPYCDVIDGCSELNCEIDKTATCSYDKKNFKAFCSCKQWHYEFDYDDNKCKECGCDNCKQGELCLSNAVKCEIIQGKKTCTCKPTYKFNPKEGKCDFCITSKEVESCEFDPEGNAVRRCRSGYAKNNGFCDKCDCGYRGTCKFKNYKKVCVCDSGYSEHGGDCRACDCGNGKCEFDGFYRKIKCICDPGYFEESGKCVELKSCYCGENATCKHENNVKKCDCAAGYQNINGICEDINECDNPNTCDPSMNCINTDGSHECVCKEGFQDSSEKPGECDDINECLKERSCPDVNTECLNTIGSYKCYCKSGYATCVDENSPVLCESKSAWKVGYGLLIGIFIAVIVILLMGIYKYQ